MLFNTWSFVLFFAVVFAFVRCTGHRTQNVFLLVASYVFYGCWDWRFTSLLAISTVCDYIIGQKVYEARESDKKSLARIWLVSSLCINLGILGFFKYFNFFADSFSDFLGLFGMSASASTLNIILPVGISFYTFQTLSYTIDIYRGELKPRKSWVDFALFVSFFPQLVAGPIERAKNFLPQIETPRIITKAVLISGGLLILQGYFKKVLVSDNIAGTVDEIFAHYGTASTVELWMGLILFSIQIYFDFSGYTDIARGVARCLGFELMTNFRQPYLSRNISEFWTRWHISLSSWLKDYLYIPLGGNRKGTFNTYRNLMITMLLGGLWHGASWNFVIWGGLHGIYLCVHKGMLSFQGDRSSVSTPLFLKLVQCLFVYFLVLLTWLPFRSPDIKTTLEYFQLMFTPSADIMLGQHLFTIFGVVLLVLLIDIPQYLNWSLNRVSQWLRMQKSIIRYPLYSLLIIMLNIIFYLICLNMLINRHNPAPFIYFQF